MFIAIAISLVVSSIYFLNRGWEYLADVGWRGRRVWLVGFLYAQAFFGALAAVIAWLAHKAGYDVWIISGITVPSILLACFIPRSMELRIDKVKRLNSEIKKGKTRASAYQQLMKYATTLPEDPQASAIEHLAVALGLFGGRYYQDARKVLGCLQRSELEPYEQELHAIIRLAACTYMNDREASDEAFAELPDLTPGSDHAHVRDLCRALTLTREGKHDEAAELARAVPEEQCTNESQPNRFFWQLSSLNSARNMVLSHIYTAQNLHAEAGKHINLLVKERGNEGLHFLIDTQAAATPVAQNMLHGTQGPYR